MPNLNFLPFFLFKKLAQESNLNQDQTNNVTFLAALAPPNDMINLMTVVKLKDEFAATNAKEEIIASANENFAKQIMNEPDVFITSINDAKKDKKGIEFLTNKINNLSNNISK